MDYNQLELERETMFKDAVLNAAESKSMEIISRAQEKSARIITEAKRKAGQKAEEIAHTKHGKDAERQVAVAQAEARQSLLFHRSVLVDEIFSDVKKELEAFAESAKYEKWLAGKIAACAAKAGGGDAKEKAEVFLRPQDMKHKAAAEKALPGCVVTEDSSITIGGAKVRFGGVLYNETLDEAMLEAKEKFYAESGLSI